MNMTSTRTRSYLLASLLFTSASAFAGQGLAAPETAAGAPVVDKVSAEEGKKHFDTGKKLVKEQIYDAALLEFEQSYKFGKRGSALKNMALCYRQLKQFAKAYETLELLVANHASELKGPEKAEVNKAMGELALVTANLTVTANEAGAEIAVDGAAVGTTPLSKAVRVNIGAHKVKATKAGFDASEEEVTLVGQQEGSVKFMLKPTVTDGHLVVRERKNSPVHVFVDEKDMGNAPWEGDLPAGSHKVEGKGEAFVAPSQTVDLAAGKKAEIVLDAVSTVAHVRFTTTPATASITLDGKDVGKGLYEGDLAEGEHEIAVAAPGHQPVTRKIKTIAGQNVVQDIALVEDPKAAAPAAAPQAPARKDNSGMYGEFTLAGLFNMGGTEAFYNPCKANQTCGHSPPVGGGLGMRLGYNFDPIGIEIAGFGMGDYRSEAVKGTGPAPSTDFVIDEASGVKRNEDFYVVGYHGFFGGGLRLLWGGVLGVTVGVTPGVVFRNYVIGRTVDLTAINQGPVVTTDKASASSFALLGDVGLVIGRKLVLGALLSYDTADNIRSAGGNPTAPQGTGQLSNVGANLPGGVTGAVLPSVKVTQPQYKITSSGQLFVGPVLTFHF